MPNKVVLPDWIKKHLGVLIALAFFVFILATVPFQKVFEYDPDEGLYLMRALMHAKGYLLYQQIWLDQPPVLVLILSFLIKIFGPSIFIARLLILSISALLLWALYQIISKKQDNLSALLAVILLIFSSFYIEMSVAVTGAIVPIAFSLLSIYMVLLYQINNKIKYLVFSGAFFAVAALTKFLALLFLPALLLEIFIAAKNRFKTELLPANLIQAYTWWLVSSLAVFIIIFLAFTPIDFHQIWHSYALGRKLPSPVTMKDIFFFNRDYDYLLMAIGGAIFLKKKEIRIIFIPLITFIVGLIFFCTHSPIWYTQRFYYTLPICWVASFGFYRLRSHIGILRESKNKILEIRSLIIVTFIGIAFGWTVILLPSKYFKIQEQVTPVVEGESKVINLMNSYHNKVHLVVTDLPIYAFYANMPVDPHLLLTSFKTLSTNIITANDYLEVIRRDRPEIVLLARFERLRSKIMPNLLKDYSLEYTDKEGANLYVLKTIIKPV